MPFFSWDEKYSVKIKRIDEQHKQLFATFEELANAMTAGTTRIALGNVLANVLKYTNTHFTQEEHLLKTREYPAYESHKRLHDEFIKQIKNYQAEFEAGAVMPVKISLFLRDWLLNHIQKIDQQYSAFLTAKGVK